MCFKKRNQPVRLAKKPEHETFEFLTGVMKSPEFWVIIAVIIIFIIAIIFAYKGATPERVYNLANITF